MKLGRRGVSCMPVDGSKLCESPSIMLRRLTPRSTPKLARGTTKRKPSCRNPARGLSFSSPAHSPNYPLAYAVSWWHGAAMNKMRIYAYVTEALKAKLAAKAEKEERSESQVIALAIKKYLDEK